ncbi:MAG: hypothetical protein EP349_03080 [Alphaproteobacteria bacterium]|nr:MAG: hypothetical protein EP349_03080 [Alphaproteobacteria bacterium]
MAETDTKQEKTGNTGPQRRITYTRQTGRLCEVELNMRVKSEGDTLERRVRMKREDISRYYSDADPSRSVIETTQGETITVVLPFSSLCKALDGAHISGKRLIDLSHVTGQEAEEREAKAQLAKLFNAEAVLSEIPEGDSLVIAYGFSSKNEKNKYMLIGFLQSEVLEVKSDNTGTYTSMKDWGEYSGTWGMSTNYGPFISKIGPDTLRTALNDASKRGLKLADLRQQTAVPAKGKLVSGLKLSPKAAKICRQAL